MIHVVIINNDETVMRLSVGTDNNSWVLVVMAV